MGAAGSLSQRPYVAAHPPCSSFFIPVQRDIARLVEPSNRIISVNISGQNEPVRALRARLVREGLQKRATDAPSGRTHRDRGQFNSIDLLLRLGIDAAHVT